MGRVLFCHGCKAFSPPMQAPSEHGVSCFPHRCKQKICRRVDLIRRQTYTSLAENKCIFGGKSAPYTVSEPPYTRNKFPKHTSHQCSLALSISPSWTSHQGINQRTLFRASRSLMLPLFGHCSIILVVSIRDDDKRRNAMASHTPTIQPSAPAFFATSCENILHSILGSEPDAPFTQRHLHEFPYHEDIADCHPSCGRQAPSCP